MPSPTPPPAAAPPPAALPAWLPAPLHALLGGLRRSAWTLPLVLAAALLVVTINEAAYRRSTDLLADLADRTGARTRIDQVWRHLTEAETGQRGYLLTARAEYLRPYQQAVGLVEGHLQWLEARYRGDVQADAAMSALRRHSLAKLSELATTVRLHAEGREDAWRALVDTGIGREHMEGVRGAAAALAALELHRLQEDRRTVFTVLHSARVGVHAMTLATVLGLVLFLRQTLAFDEVQRRHARALQAERDRLEAEVRRRTTDLTRLARHLQTAREDEKSHLARELHDELGALLTAVKLDAARLKRALAPLAPDAAARLAHLLAAVDQGIELKRRIIEDLRPSLLTTLGLVPALESLLNDHVARSGQRLRAELQPVALGEGAAITVFRVVQEALTNVLRHAQARQLVVTLEPAPHDGRAGVRLRVQDDGRGFDPARADGGTHGLMGMRYRVESEGGWLVLHSAPGAGTTVQAWLPAGEAGGAEDGAGGAGMAPRGDAASIVSSGA